MHRLSLPLLTLPLTLCARDLPLKPRDVSPQPDDVLANSVWRIGGFDALGRCGLCCCIVLGAILRPLQVGVNQCFNHGRANFRLICEDTKHIGGGIRVNGSGANRLVQWAQRPLGPPIAQNDLLGVG